MGYRRIRLGQIGNSQTIDFAVQELVTYLKKMDSMLFVDVLRTETIEQDFQNIIWVGLDTKLEDKVPKVEDCLLDDAIAVQVEAGNGYITGSNERSVLLAVYRFLKALGCDWVRPGQEGERIPTKEITDINVYICEAASYRHRGVCIEGADTYENIRDMIDYLPKVGMNAYFMQFMVPGVFFTRWYDHLENSYLQKEEISREEIEAMVLSLEAEIGKRGLSYHKTGHGWTCEPFGIDGTSWDSEKTYLVPEETKKYLAQVDGKRELWNNVPLNTNLCYSNPSVRKRMTDAITDYCKKNQHVDVLHVWLADGMNNHCECEECIKKRPADWYVTLLNELDEKLTDADINTKIVFLIYVDLLWEPIEERLHNPERFILMFAPITRNYGQNYGDHLIYEGELPPYVRNKLDMPDSLEQNLEQLRRWQSMFEGDSFVFDYHLMWAHVNDLGYELCARNFYDDIRGFHKLGVNGMFNCQVHRSFFPSALPFNIMAATLWNENCDYEEKVMSYYESAFGKDGGQVHEYLKTISDLVMLYHNPGYMNRSYVKAPFCKEYEKLRTVVSNFKLVIEQHIQKESEETRREWEMLFIHQQYVMLLADIMELSEQNKEDEVKARFSDFLEFLNCNEIQTQKVLDSWNMIDHWKRFV